MDSSTPRWELPYQLNKNDQLIFLHIGKTGGSTLSEILEGMFQPEEIIPRYGSMNILRKKETPESIENSRLIRAHAHYTALQNLSGKNKLFLTMLRDPVDRVISYYNYVRAESSHPMHRLANEFSLEIFLDLQVFRRYEWVNYQLQLLSSTLTVPINSIEDVDLAKQRLQNEFIWYGITERFDESLDLLSYTFNWPSLLDYKKVNVTKKGMKREDISPSTIDKITDLNSLEVDLYQYSVELFGSRCESMEI